MNQQNKYSGKRPVMFYQAGNDDVDSICGPRIRIFYPDGFSEWGSLKFFCHPDHWFKDPPCYLLVDGVMPNYKYKNGIHIAIKAAKDFDKRQGFKPMQFLGEL